VRQPPDHHVTRTALAAATATPPVELQDAAGKDRAIRPESLAGDLEPELIKAAEGGQISAAEAGHGGSVSHVEVFQMRRVGTLILGRPRPLSGHRHANRSYTLNREEPAIHGTADYRRRDHAGLSAATTNNYDQAVHLNRKPPFGIAEIQVMTFDLYRRVHCDPASADSHDAFVARREQLLRDRMQ